MSMYVPAELAIALLAAYDVELETALVNELKSPFAGTSKL